MSKRFGICTILSALGALTSLALTAADPAATGNPRITGPYTHENLSIYLIHSAGNATGRKLLTLQEAMDQKKTVVYETGSVNQLAIENQSSEEVYIQAGDIVKGGQQDRVLSTDLLLPAHSGKLPIASFCVEQGRWSKRGAEAADQFGSSNAVVAGKALKMAVMDKKDQGQVWNQVAAERDGLAIAAPVAMAGSVSSGSGSAGGVASGSGGGYGPAAAPPASPAALRVNPTVEFTALANSTSMQMAMDSKPVVDATAGYLRDLAKVVDGQSDVVGYAYAINGKLNSAEVYSSRELFLKMWPKLVRSSAVEALAERPKAQDSQKAPGIPAVQAILSEAEKAAETSKQANGSVTVVKKESAGTLLFETRDQGKDGAWMHRSYVVK
jgi:hypothetical protein